MGCEQITSDILIQGTTITSLPLASVVHTPSNFRIKDNPLLTMLHLPELLHRPADRYNFDIRNCSSLASVTMPKADDVWIDLRNNPRLVSISAPVATRGALTVENSPLLTTVDFPAFVETETISFQDCASLKSLSFPSLQQSHIFYLKGLADLTMVSLPALTGVGDWFRVEDNPRLSNITMPRFNSVRAIQVERNPLLATFTVDPELTVDALYLVEHQLKTISFPANTHMQQFVVQGKLIHTISMPSLKVVTGDLRISDTNVTTLDFPVLEQAGTLAIQNTPFLTTLQLPVLYAVTWSLSLDSNPLVDALRLPAINTTSAGTWTIAYNLACKEILMPLMPGIFGEFNIRDNHALERLDISSLQFSGNFFLEQQGPMLEFNAPEYTHSLGHIVWQNTPSLERFLLPKLRYVDQAFFIVSCHNATTVYAPLLEHADRVYMGMFKQLVTFDLSSLHNTTDWIHLTEFYSDMPVVSFPSLVHVGGYLELNRIPDIDAPRLQTVGARLFSVQHSAPLFSLPSLVWVGSDVNLHYSVMTVLDLPLLRRIEGQLTVDEHTQLETFELPILNSTNGINLAANAKLIDASFPALVENRGDFALRGNPLLAAEGVHVPGMRGIGRDLRIENQVLFTAVNTSHLPAVTFVNGIIFMKDNANLAVVSLPTLPQCAGLHLEHNPLLERLRLDSLADISGPLVVHSCGFPSLDLSVQPPLASAASVTIQSNSGLTALTFGSLTALLGGIRILSNPVLPAVHMATVLTTGALDIQSNTVLGALTVALHTATAEVTIQSNPALTGIIADSLTSAGSLTIGSNAVLTDVRLPLLAATAEDLRIESNAALVSIALPALTAVNRDASIKSNGVLAGLALDRLTTVGGTLIIKANAALRNVTLGVSTVGSLAVEANAALETVQFPRLASLASFSVEGNSLTTLRFPSLASVASLALSDAGLSSLAGLSALTTVTAAPVLSLPNICCPLLAAWLSSFHLSTPPALCAPLCSACVPVVLPAHGLLPDSFDVAYGALPQSIACESGYAVGGPSRLCQLDATWAGEEQTCVTCPAGAATCANGTWALTCLSTALPENGKCCASTAVSCAALGRQSCTTHNGTCGVSTPIAIPPVVPPPSVGALRFTLAMRENSPALSLAFLNELAAAMSVTPDRLLIVGLTGTTLTIELKYSATGPTAEAALANLQAHFAGNVAPANFPTLAALVAANPQIRVLSDPTYLPSASKKMLYIGIAVGVGLVLLVATVIVWAVCRKRRHKAKRVLVGAAYHRDADKNTATASATPLESPKTARSREQPVSNTVEQEPRAPTIVVNNYVIHNTIQMHFPTDGSETSTEETLNADVDAVPVITVQ